MRLAHAVLICFLALSIVGCQAGQGGLLENRRNPKTVWDGYCPTCVDRQPVVFAPIQSGIFSQPASPACSRCGEDRGGCGCGNKKGPGLLARLFSCRNKNNQSTPVPAANVYADPIPQNSVPQYVEPQNQGDCGCPCDTVPIDGFYGLGQIESGTWVDSAPVGTTNDAPVDGTIPPEPASVYENDESNAEYFENAPAAVPQTNETSSRKPVVDDELITEIEVIKDPIVVEEIAKEETVVEEKIKVQPVSTDPFSRYYDGEEVPEMEVPVAEPVDVTPVPEPSPDRIARVPETPEADITPDVPAPVTPAPVVPAPVVPAPVVPAPVVPATIEPAPVEQVITPEPKPIVLRARPTESHFVSPESLSIIARQNQVQPIDQPRMIQASSTRSDSHWQRVDEFGLPADELNFSPLPGENHPSVRETNPAHSDPHMDLPEQNVPAIELPAVDIERRIQEEVERQIRELNPAPVAPQTLIPQSAEIPADEPVRENLSAKNDTLILQAVPNAVPKVGSAIIRGVSSSPATNHSADTGSMPNILNYRSSDVIPQDDPFTNAESIIIQELPAVEQIDVIDIDNSLQQRVHGLTEKNLSVDELLER